MKKLFKIALLVGCCAMLFGCGNSDNETRDVILKIEDCYIYDREGTELIGVFGEVTNNTGETIEICDYVDVVGFQNGIQSDFLVYPDEYNGYIECDKYIQDGTTAKVMWNFVNKDDSPISIETSDGQTFEYELK